MDQPIGLQRVRPDQSGLACIQHYLRHLVGASWLLFVFPIYALVFAYFFIINIKKKKKTLSAVSGIKTSIKNIPSVEHNIVH